MRTIPSLESQRYGIESREDASSITDIWRYFKYGLALLGLLIRMKPILKLASCALSKTTPTH